jgi:hypothetical protein
MIHTARQSPKFIKLVRRLRPLIGQSAVSAEGIAVCVLETLWHATTTGAMRGDIGQFDNEVIAEMCCWQGDADTLIEILTDCKYLDPCPEHRLVVHDWFKHAPNHVKGNVTKQGGFVTPKTEDTIEAQPLGPSLKGPAPSNEPQGTGAPNLTQPNPTQPSSGRAAKSPDYPVWFEEFWGAYPSNDKGRKRGKAKSYKLAQQVPADDRGDLVKAASAYRSESDGYVRDPERFIKDDFWRDYVGERERPSHLPKPKGPRKISVEDMRYRLVKSGRKAARDWPDETVEHEFQKLATAPSRRLNGAPEVKLKTVGTGR